MFIDWVYDSVQVPVMMVTAISTGTWPQEENIKTLATICVQLKQLQTNLHSTIRVLCSANQMALEGCRNQSEFFKAGYSTPYLTTEQFNIIMTLLP